MRKTLFSLAAVALLPLAACSAALEVTIPTELVAPGSDVAVGETVLVPGSAYEKRSDGQHLTDTEVALTVAKVEHSDESLFEELANPEDFVGYTPVLVATQVDVDPESDFQRPGSASPWAIMGNGEYAEYLTLDRFGSSDNFCWSSTNSPATTELGCTVFLLPEGETLAALEWDGQKSNAMGIHIPDLSADDPLLPYLEQPLNIILPEQE